MHFLYSYSANQQSREKNIFPEGFVTNILVLAYVGEPLEINRNAFGCHVSVPRVSF